MFVGHEFEFVQKLRTSNSELEIVQKAQEKKERWVNVSSVSYAIHEKKNFPDSLKVTYHCGISSFSEYVCLNHTGYAKHVATNWVSFRWTGKYFPLNVAQLFRESNLLKVPKRLYIDSSSKYKNQKY
jgi:DNA repair protein RadD